MVMSLFAGSQFGQSHHRYSSGWLDADRHSTIVNISGGFNAKLLVMWKRAASEGTSYTFLPTLSTQAATLAIQPYQRQSHRAFSQNSINENFRYCHGNRHYSQCQQRLIYGHAGTIDTNPLTG
jgi:hypothetical protein